MKVSTYNIKYLKEYIKTNKDNPEKVKEAKLILNSILRKKNKNMDKYS